MSPAPDASMMASPEDNIPKAPPRGLRSRYIALSWAYVRWCLGMLLWAILCIVYFILTGQMVEMGIGIFLGVILLAMIAGPAFLFGGETWYKRLGWIVVLLSMFSMIWPYPLITAAWGIFKRIRDERYWPVSKVTFNDWLHALLCLMTITLAIWTFILTVRVLKLTRQLARGEFGEMDIRVKEQ